MDAEFRLYGKLNCNYFDLVSGKHEPQQTKGLGLLLSKSPKALEIFLRLLFLGKHINKLLDMRCVIDCEACQKEDAETNKSKRADIIIRFFNSHTEELPLILTLAPIFKSASLVDLGERVLRDLGAANRSLSLKVGAKKIVTLELTL